MCMEKDRWVEGLLEYLKEKEKISELEKDILSTIQTYKKVPFDRAEAERKITNNNFKYINLSTTISLLSGSSSKPFNCLSTENIKHTLYLQINTMGLMAHLDLDSL